MVVTITSLRLRNPFLYFKLTYLALGIVGQIRKQPGFLKMKNTGFGYMHFTLSAWESEKDLKAFAHSGAHLQAMRESGNLATEIRIHTFPGERIPDWKEAKELVLEKGKVLSFP
jgi:hypothetical protein